MGMNRETEEIGEREKRRDIKIAIDKFKKLTDPKTKGGCKRREILGFISKNPGRTAYEITRCVYGDPKSYKSTVFHLRKLQKIFELVVDTEWGSLLEEKREYQGTKISLTENGETLCRQVNIKPPIGRADELIMDLNRVLREPLVPTQIKNLRVLLLDSLLCVLYKIAQDYQEAYLNAGYTAEALKLPTDLDKILCSVWVYDVERREIKKLLDRSTGDPIFDHPTGDPLLDKYWQETVEEGKKWLIAVPKVSPELGEKMDKLVGLLDEIVGNDPFLLKMKHTTQMEHVVYHAAKRFRQSPIPYKK